MNKVLLAILAFAALGLAGCAQTEPAANGDSSSASSSQAATVKCEGCGAEVAEGSLASHDGKMLCEACIAAHGH